SGRQAPQGTARLNISGVDLARAEAIPSNLPRVLTQLKLVSAIAGKSELHWTGSPTNLEAGFALELSAPNEVPPPQVPVHGTLNGSYSAVTQRVDVRQLNVATRWTRIDAVGTLGASVNPSAALRVNINTTDVSEFQPVLRATGYSSAFPVQLHGRASFSGIVNGKLNAPTLSGHLQLTDFETESSLSTPGSANVPMAASNKPAQAREERVHWNSLVGDISYSADSAAIKNMLLKHGRASISANATAGLVKGTLTDT